MSIIDIFDTFLLMQNHYPSAETDILYDFNAIVLFYLTT